MVLIFVCVLFYFLDWTFVLGIIYPMFSTDRNKDRDPDSQKIGGIFSPCTYQVGR